MKTTALIAAIFLAGCSPSYEDQQAKIERFAKANRFGDYQDMWLVRDGMFATERVALIYAMGPDSEFCAELAQMYNEKYPTGAVYSCEPAN